MPFPEKIKYEFESIPIGLKYHILNKNVELHTQSDLICALNNVLHEEEGDEMLPIMKRLAHQTLAEMHTPTATDINSSNNFTI